MADESFYGVERELGLLLRRASASSTALARDVHPDLEPAAYVLLARIAAAPDIRAGELAAFIGVGRGTMSRQLARLCDLGLLTRSPDPDDFRKHLLELTDEGRRRLDDAQHARRGFLHRALADWTPDESDALAEHLARLNQALADARQRGSVAQARIDDSLARARLDSSLAGARRGG